MTELTPDYFLNFRNINPRVAMEHFPWIVQLHDATSSPSPRIFTYAGLLRTDQAEFAKRHLAEGFKDAVDKYDALWRKNVPKQTFFLVEEDTEFYHIPKDHIISARPLLKVDFKGAKIPNPCPKNPADFYNLTTKGTYCIWHKSDDHFDSRFWDDFNHLYKGEDPRRIKRIVNRGDIEPEGIRVFREGAIEPEQINLRPNYNSSRSR